MKLNDPQSRHLANSLRAYGLGQVAAFGYAGVQSGHWWTAVLSIGFLLLCEASALTVLNDMEDEQ